MDLEWEKNGHTCKELLGKNCLLALKNLYRLSQDLDKEILSFKLIHFQIPIKPQRAYDLDLILGLDFNLDQMHLLNFNVLNIIEHAFIVLDTDYLHYYKKINNLTHYLHGLRVLSEIEITSLLSGKIQPDFESAWKNFFLKIDKYILIQKDTDFLINNLGPLNLSWNTFHMKMEKGHSEFNISNVKFIKIIHNRWNSILKIILRKK